MCELAIKAVVVKYELFPITGTCIWTVLINLNHSLDP